MPGTVDHPNAMIRELTIDFMVGLEEAVKTPFADHWTHTTIQHNKPTDFEDWTQRRKKLAVAAKKG